MNFIHVVLILICIGVVLWLVNRFIPMDRKIKMIINIVVVLAVIVWLLNVFGVLAYLGHVRIGKLR